LTRAAMRHERLRAGNRMAIQNHADVISESWGAPTSPHRRQCRGHGGRGSVQHGITVVVASGNADRCREHGFARLVARRDHGRRVHRLSPIRRNRILHALRPIQCDSIAAFTRKADLGGSERPDVFAPGDAAGRRSRKRRAKTPTTKPYSIARSPARAWPRGDGERGGAGD